MGMNWKIMGFGMALCVPSIYFLARGFDFDPRALPEELVGQPAPSFELTSFDGYQISSKDIQCSPIVINFWASWCKPCLSEHPYLLEIAAEYKSKGIVFLGILYGDTQSKGEIFLKKHGSAYPTLLDPTQRTSIDYGVAGVPETYVIDGAGNIIHKFTGPIDPVILRGLLDEVLVQ